MKIDEHTYQDLVTAFSHKITLETSFYWKKAKRRIVEVSFLDYALISDGRYNYISGLNPEEEREIKEAIIANEKNQNTHLLIPRLSFEDRIEIMNLFIGIQTDAQYKSALQMTLNKIVDLKESKPIDLLKNGFKAGFDLDNLASKTDELKDSWIEFYRAQTKPHVDKWLREIETSSE